jgi:hypothetical protein
MNPSISKIVKILTTAILFIALLELPYGFYTFLRIVVTIVAILSAITSFRNNINGWGIIFILVGILFNPIIPIYLDKGIWMPIDIVVGVLFFITIFIKKTYITDN